MKPRMTIVRVEGRPHWLGSSDTAKLWMGPVARISVAEAVKQFMVWLEYRKGQWCRRFGVYHLGI